MATEYGNPKFRDSNKNLLFRMNGQPATDTLAKIVNTVGANNITISNTKFSSNSDYSNTHNNSVKYDKIINSTSKTYRIDWKLKSNVGTHPSKTTSLEYGLLSWFDDGTEGKPTNPVTYTSTKHQLKGINNFNPSRSLADLRYFDAKIKVNNLDGDINKEVVFNTESSFAGDNTQIKGIAQGYYNYNAPYTVFTAESPVNWISFQTSNGGTSNNISITSSSGDISNNDNVHYLVISDNSPLVLYGDISGKHTVHYNIDKDANGNSISNTYAGSVTFTSNNDGKAFVTTNTDKSNSTSHPRNATITYSLTDYNTYSSGASGTLSGSFSIYQAGGNITPKDPELSYSWKITSGSEYVSKTEVITTSVNAKQDNGNYQQYSYANKYVINVKDNSGTIGSITGTPSISNISNPKPIYKVGTFDISGLTMTPAINTNDRNITVNTKVSGNYCTNFNVSNPSIDTIITQPGSNWVSKPTVVGKLSITCENPQTDRIDQSNPASFTIRQTSSNNYSSSLSNVALSEGKNEFGYKFGTISASSTNISVSGKIKVENSNKIFEISGESKSYISLYPETLTFNPGYSKKVDDIRWKLKFTPDTTQNDKQITNVKSSEITVIQAGIPQGSEITYNPLTISGAPSENWLTVTNDCTFNYNDYNNYTQENPNKMILKADPNRTSINGITVTDTNNSNIYKVQITNASVAEYRSASITLSSSDSNTILSKTTISDFTQLGENINCNISLTYQNPNDINNKHVDLINTDLNISDTNEHNLSIPRDTTGHTNNTITGLTAVKDGNNDTLTISTSDNAETLWWKANNSVNVDLKINASGNNLGEYGLSKRYITVIIPGDSPVTPSVKWYSRTTPDGNWTEISSESSKQSISVSGSAAMPDGSGPVIEQRPNVGLTDKPFKVTRGKPTSAATTVYYKVESNTGGSAGADNSVYVQRTGGFSGFGSISVTASSTNITIITDNVITVDDSDLKVPGSNPNTEYANWYVYGPVVTLTNKAITTIKGLTKITDWNVGASKSGDNIPETISAFAETKDKEFSLSASVNPSVDATWEASVSAGDDCMSSDSGSFNTNKYGSSNIWTSITYNWSTGETSSNIIWKPDVHVAKDDYIKSVSCEVIVTFQDGKTISDTLTWSVKVLKTNVKFEGTLKCSDDKTITAFDSQTYNTSAWVDGYKVTATSGILTSDWTKSYNYILNATSKTLTAIQGSNGSVKGDASFEYTLKSPDISNANVTTVLDQKHTVHLYCYGKSYYNG